MGPAAWLALGMFNNYTGFILKKFPQHRMVIMVIRKRSSLLEKEILILLLGNRGHRLS